WWISFALNYCTRDNSGNGYYSYAVAGYVTIRDVADSCTVEMVSITSSPLVRERGSNLSWLDLNKELEYGFQASWGTYGYFCSSMCRERASCFGNSVNVTAVCVDPCLSFDPESCPVIFFFIDRCSLSEIF
ncbi:hypothetical protein C3L33_03915, partial [Rhododendron williamsianum]